MVNMADGQIPLVLQTKLHRPPVGNDYVIRPRLLERLVGNPNRLLTLVTAPAGSGKTTLVSAWIETMQRPAAWLSIDQNDSNLPVFLSYVVAAIRSLFPEACPETEVLLRSSFKAPAEIFTTTFINELVRLPHNFVLVLDDYHFIQDEAIHQFMIRLIRQRPRNLHLVLVTRVNPPFPVSSLRAASLQLLEIRMRDLRFTTEEMRAFVLRVMGDQAAELTQDDALAVIEERTEGWAAGLRLAMLSLQGHPHPKQFLGQFQGTSAYVMDYLMDQVISQQAPEIVTTLLFTSILDRFCAPLCEAILAGEANLTATAFLEWVDHANLFVTPLDERREWRRYDHLFCELLLSRLQAQSSPEMLAVLHARASDWFAENSFVDDAIRHALAANDPVRAARAVEKNVQAVLAREDRATLERWLHALPETIKQTRPALMAAGAWLWHLRGNTLAVYALLQDVDAAIANGDHDLSADGLSWVQGSTAALLGEYWFAKNSLERAIEHCQHAVDKLPPDGLFERRTAVAYLCFAKQAMGEMVEVERIVASEMLRSELHGGTYTAPYYQILCWIRLISGDLDQLRHAAQHLLKESQRNRLMLSMTWAHYFLGLLRYEWNDLESAAAHFQTIAERRYSAHFTAAQESMLGLALIRHAQGSAQEARETTEALAVFNLEQAGSISNKARSAQARLAEMQGDHVTYAQWLGSVELSTPDRPIPLFDEPSMTRARVLIAENSAVSLRQAIHLLVQIRDLAVSMHNERRLIEVFALQAMAFQALDQLEMALDALQRAVQMAQPGGFVRMFLDLGRPMRALLVMLEKRGIAPSYLQRLLAAFALSDAENGIERPSDASPGRGGTGDGSGDGDSAASPASLLLTPRELEVLGLLDSPLSDKEIAARLFVTVNTVKRHTGSIYLKLGVHSRRRAVARAKKLRIVLAAITA